jgi:hypothetical protein
MPAHRSTAALLALLSSLTACATRGAAVEDLVESLALCAELDVSGPTPGTRPPRPLVEDGVFYVLGADPSHPRVRYLDGQVALNESCMIQLGNKLSRKIPPVYVNGQPLGFC